jgi:hypothetical protein
MDHGWLLVAAAAALVPSSEGPDASQVPYPEGYRRWAHVKTQLVSPDNPRAGRFAGMHHVYANAPALEGYETGRFPGGAVIVFDLLDVRTADGNTEEGSRKFVDVMLKDGARFAATGGWGYQEFEGPGRERRLDAAKAAACSACHARLAPSDHVISTLRE